MRAISVLRVRQRHSAGWAFVAGLTLIGGWPAHASLGGGRDTVEGDRRHLAAQISTTVASSHAVHVLTLPNGEVVREFTRGDGVVFAVAWRGPARPDLRQLLGPRFDTVQADNVLPGGRRTRRPLAVRRADFVMSSGGHPGAFWGVAYLPAEAPAGFSLKDLTAPAA